MIKSMTGFGRSEAESKERKITVEMKAVNHRFLDMSIRIPKKFSFFEASIRNVVKQYINRGKVDIFISYEDYTEENVCLQYNETIAREYMKYLKRMNEDFGLNQEISVVQLAKFPEVFSLKEETVDEDAVWSFVEGPVREAAERLAESRIVEGSHLKQDIMFKLDEIWNQVECLKKREPEIVEAYRNKIYAKVSELLGDNTVSESVLATEITIFADKICVDEEMVRLQSHIKTMKDTLEDGDNIGRKLDFIAQEMNREANTTLSKANDMELSNVAIDLKTEIEKIREQIQNIE